MFVLCLPICSVNADVRNITNNDRGMHIQKQYDKLTYKRSKEQTNSKEGMKDIITPSVPIAALI